MLLRASSYHPSVADLTNAPVAEHEQNPAAGYKILWKAFLEEWRLLFEHINAYGFGMFNYHMQYVCNVLVSEHVELSSVAGPVRQAQQSKTSTLWVQMIEKAM